jgi:hypothetical protein
MYGKYFVPYEFKELAPSGVYLVERIYPAKKASAAANIKNFTI